MPNKLERLERLNELLDKGRISEKEYTELKAEILDNAGEEFGGTSSTEHARVSDPQPSTITTTTPTKADTPTIYKVAFGFGIASIFLGGTFGLLAWATVAIGAWALYSEDADVRRWMAWTGLALGILFSFMNAYLNGHLDFIDASSRTGIASGREVNEEANLGVTYEIFINRWNFKAQSSGNRIDAPRYSDYETFFVNHFDEDLSGSNIYASKGFDDEIHLVSLHHNPEVSSFDDFLERWRLVCVAVMGPALEMDCISRTMTELGVSDDPNNSNWNREYVAEYLDDGICWQLDVSGVGSPIYLTVDAVGQSGSACRSDIL